MEEALTLDELMVTYNKILDNRTQHMEFSARLAGAEIKGSSNKGQPSEPKQSNLVQNLKKARESKLESQAKTGKNATFSDGVAYKVI